MEPNNIHINRDYHLLEKIQTPDDLRIMSQELLPEVCSELRNFIIESLSKNPGHFASSMGAVEITVALHYVFNTPYDRIVWDVGHQAYSHKILTGRRERFATNRTKGGLSGFPNPDESEYDAFIAGHASNSISAALGMAMASTINHDSPRRNIVAVIGDASISGGLAFEGLNNASINKNNLLIVLNDNDMAIDQNVGALNEYMTHLNTSPRYNRLRFKAYMMLKNMGLIDEENKSKILRFNNSLKSLLTNQQNIFEGLNIRYFGPFDGHDVAGLVKVLRDIKDLEGPRILHVRTRKGKGYTPAEKDPTTWHAPGKFDPETGITEASKKPSVPPLKYQDVFGHTIVELAEKNPKIVGITAAMASGTSLSMMIERFPERTFDVGISEGHAVTFSAGLAKEGLIPYCCIYSTFLQRGFDQLIHDVAIQRLPVTFCIDRGGLVGEDGVTHNGAFDLAYLRLIPGMTIAAPIDEHDLRNLLFTAQLKPQGPLAIRYPRGKGNLTDWHNDFEEMPIGKGRKLKDGNDVALLTVGPIGQNALKVATRLETEGVSVAVYNMIFVKPLDTEILTEVAAKFSHIITIEDGTVVGGFGSAVVEWFNDNCLNKTVTRLGIPDRFIHQATVAQQREECGIDDESIKQAIFSRIKK